MLARGCVEDRVMGSNSWKKKPSVQRCPQLPPHLITRFKAHNECLKSHMCPNESNSDKPPIIKLYKLNWSHCSGGELVHLEKANLNKVLVDKWTVSIAVSIHSVPILNAAQHKTKRKTSKRHALQPTQLNAFSHFHHMSPWEEFSSYATQFCFARLWVWLCNTGNKEFDTYLNRVPSSGCFNEGFKRNTFKCKSMYFISAAYLYCNYFC